MKVTGNDSTIRQPPGWVEIALFTLALTAGATPAEAAEIANHASGVVVGKLGTATVTPAELLASFEA